MIFTSYCNYVTHKEPFLQDGDSAYMVMAQIINTSVHYIRIVITDVETNASDFIEQVFEDKESARKYFNKILSLYPKFDMRILSFDKEYSNEYEAEIINKWLHNEV